jgi:hypothetical protein
MTDDMNDAVAQITQLVDREVARERARARLALAELNGLDNANLDGHERACLNAAIQVLRDV